MDQTKSDTNILRGGCLLPEPAISIDESLFIGTEGSFVQSKKVAIYFESRKSITISFVGRARGL